MKFACYSDWDQLPESANALFEQGEKDSIFLSRPWFEILSAAVPDDDQAMVLACVITGDKVMAILPLVKGKANTGYSLRHRYTPYYSFLIAETEREEILDCLVQGLRQLSVEALLLEPVADSDSKMNSLQQSMNSAGFCSQRLFRHYNWIYRVQGQSYEEYMESRPAKLRNTITRKIRKLEREHGYEIRLFTGGEAIQAMPDYHAVYCASWKANEQYLEFVNDMVSRFSGAGWTRLAILYVRERPVAAQLWFVAHDKAYIFRLAYDESWKRYSVGSILTSHLMQYVIDIDKVQEIDFLTGNDVYKQDWMSERRQRFALSFTRVAGPGSEGNRFIESLKKKLKWKKSAEIK